MGATEHKTKAEIVVITPEKARALLDFSEKSGFRNRRLSSAAVRRYASEMRQGNWKTTGTGLSLTAEGILLDGYHRLHAVLLAGVTVEMSLTYGVRRDAFAVMDQGKRREVGDLLYIDGFQKYSQYLGPAAKQVYCYVTRGVFLSRLNNVFPAYDKIRPVVAQHEDEMVVAAQEYLDGQKRGKSIIPPNIFISLWILFNSVDGQQNAVFMNALMTGADLAEDDPRLALRRYLIDMKNSRGVRAIDMALQAAYVVAAWNKFINGQKCQLLRIPQKNKFPAIYGFDKSRFAWGATEFPGEGADCDDNAGQIYEGMSGLPEKEQSL